MIHLFLILLSLVIRNCSQHLYEMGTRCILVTSDISGSVPNFETSLRYLNAVIFVIRWDFCNINLSLFLFSPYISPFFLLPSPTPNTEIDPPFPPKAPMTIFIHHIHPISKRQLCSSSFSGQKLFSLWFLSFSYTPHPIQQQILRLFLWNIFRTHLLPPPLLPSFYRLSSSLIRIAVKANSPVSLLAALPPNRLFSTQQPQRAFYNVTSRHSSAQTLQRLLISLQSKIWSPF